MSDTSSSSFSELKDNESGAASTSIPINTSLVHTDKPLPTSVPKPASVTKAALSSDYSTLFIPAPHPAFSVDWFAHYLKQTRVLVVLALLVFTLVLVIWIASLGKAGPMSSSGPGAVCAAWASTLVPDVVSQCPPVEAEVYYAGSNGRGLRAEGGDSLLQYSEVANLPVALFVPGAPQSYYYTAIFLDPDVASRSNVRGIYTNLRLGNSVDLQRGDIVMQYEAPDAPVTTTHRYVWLVYRHSQPTSGLQAPMNNNGFNVDDWVASNFQQKPTLAAAAYFNARSNVG